MQILFWKLCSEIRVCISIKLLGDGDVAHPSDLLGSKILENCVNGRGNSRKVKAGT